MDRLKGQWSSTQIASATKSFHEKNMKFIQEKLNDPQDYLGKHGEAWDKLKAYATAEKQ